MRCAYWSPLSSARPLPALIWFHGGGFSSGSERNLRFTMAGKSAKHVPMILISPGYRKLRHGSFPLAFEDCYACYKYVVENAESLGIDPNRIMVGGESAGGNLAAAVAIKARDEGIAPHYQFLIYPMLTPVQTESHLNKKARFWTKKRNDHAWARYLKGNEGKVTPLMAPGLLQDFKGLPPAYSFVLKDELFYQETIDYINHLKEAGIEAHVDIYRGGLHGFDMWFPLGKRAKKAAEDFLAALRLALS